MDRPQRPFFRAGVRGVDEGFTEIDLAAVAEILGEPLQESIETAGSMPLLKPSVAGLVRRVATRQIVPRRPGAEDPEHTVEHRARIGPRPAASVGAHARSERRFEYRPLGVGEVHAPRYDASTPVVTPMLRGL